MMSLVNKLTLGLGAVILSGCATDVLTPYADPVSFNDNTYCQTVDREADLVISEDIEAVLSEDNTSATEEDIANALLVKAAMEIAHTSSDEASCQNIFKSGEKLFRQVLSDKQDLLKTAGGFKPSKDQAILAIQTDITRLWREDQSARGAYMSLNTEDRKGASYWAQRLATAHATRIDAESKSYIETVLEDYDWVDRKRFDGAISDHAWILVQHADDHPEFQSKVLARMEPYLESGGVKSKNYAYLWDRVAVNTGKKQRYGTQPKWECEGGMLELQPLEDPDNVNERRAKMGLNTVEQGLERMASQVCLQKN